MPAEIKGDPESTYVAFESHARLFVTKYRACGWKLKAYGHHLWTSMPLLMRKWGSLELVSQQVVEGMIGKVARIMPHIQLNPVGAYPEGIRGNRTLELEELAKRRANADAPAERITEELMMETLQAKYGLGNNDTQAMTHAEYLLTLDECIAKRNTTPAELFDAYCFRYLLVEKLRARSRRVARQRRAAARLLDDGFRALAHETASYFSPALHKWTVSAAHTNEEWAAVMMRVRKGWWKERRGVREKGGRFSGRQFAYQAMPPLPPAIGCIKRPGEAPRRA